MARFDCRQRSAPARTITVRNQSRMKIIPEAEPPSVSRGGALPAHPTGDSGASRTPSPAIAPSVKGNGVGSRRRRVVLSALSLMAVVGDFLAVLAGMAAAYWMRFDSGYIPFFAERSHPGMVAYGRLFVVGGGLLVMTFMSFQLYSPEMFLQRLRSIRMIVQGVAFWCAVYLVTSLVLESRPPISRIYALLSFGFCGGALLIWRRVLCSIARTKAVHALLQRKVFVFGWSGQMAKVVETIEHDVLGPYRVVHCVKREIRIGGRNGDFRAELEALVEVVRERAVDVVVLANEDLPNEVMFEIVALCERNFVEFKKVPSHFQVLLSGLALESFYGLPVLSISALPLDRMRNRALKRLVDIVGALVGLFLSLPLIAVFGSRVKRESPGPVFFSQVRVGRRGEPFRMLKIRTMKVGAEAEDDLHQSTAGDDSRLLTIGKFMRQWNIDEVPQFWNVLKGEMSLVGPRPERPMHSDALGNSIPHYTARYFGKPGMTGWAQINGFRGPTSLEGRVRCDLYYWENWSLLLDLQIMLQTLRLRDPSF